MKTAILMVALLSILECGLAISQSVETATDSANRNRAGVALLNRGDYNGAAAIFEEAVKLRPDHAVAYYNLGTALFYLGQYEKARQTLLKATKIDPAFSKAFNQLGVVQTELKDYRSARNSFATVMALDRSDALGPANYGSMLIRMGKIAKSIEWLERANRQGQANLEVKFNLAYAYGRKKRFREAVAEARSALKLDPADEDTRLMLVALEVASGNKQAALDEYQAVKLANPPLGRRMFDAIHGKWVINVPPRRTATGPAP